MALDDDKSETSDADLAETFDDDLLTPSDQAVLEPADMAKSKSPWRAPILLAIGIEIIRMKPCFKIGFQWWPVAINGGKPAGIAVMALEERGLSEHAFKRQTKPFRRPT